MLRNLAAEETQVEIARQNLCFQTSFDPKKAFAMVDQKQIGNIDGQDIIDFLGQYHCRVEMGDALDLIREYDASLDQ